jgi:ketosteroid isomerase-like protein
LPWRAVAVTVDRVDDIAALIASNEHFIEACRRGSWESLREILGDDFCYLDGRTGETWNQNRYVTDLRNNPAPSLAIDEVVIHVAGNTATVSARTHSDGRPRRSNRYLDTYERRDGRWLCVHACVWPLPEGGGAMVVP